MAQNAAEISECANYNHMRLSITPSRRKMQDIDSGLTWIQRLNINLQVYSIEVQSIENFPVLIS